MAVVDELLARNAAYAADFDLQGLPTPPAKRLAVVTCMDARIDPLRALGLAPGDAHVIRNAGGVVTDDVVRSLLLSQRILGTRSVLLIHHTECGLHGLDVEAFEAEVSKATGMRLPFPVEAFDDLDESVRVSVARVRAHRLLPDTDEVRGFVLDVSTGRLREVR